jgi:hypothetical protein
LVSQRLWRFRNGAGDEFGYSIRDELFLEGLLTGRRKIPMKAGIQITATVETHESKDGDVWEVTDRWITVVHRVHREKQEPDLCATPKPKKAKRGKSRKK